MSEVISAASNIPCQADLFVSTDTEQKAEFLRSAIGRYRNGATEVRVFPNRGRDIAPKLIGFADVYARYEIFLHLHGKQSPQLGEWAADWRRYLFESLCGSAAIVSGILDLFDRTDVGVIYPQHFPKVLDMLNWGYDFDLASELLDRVGVKLDRTMELEFPSGSMFWGRSAALAGLLKLNLTFDDFPSENGQTDGTLAHAIERTLLMFAEKQGYRWLKFTVKSYAHLFESDNVISTVDQLDAAMAEIYRPLLIPYTPGVSAIEAADIEVRSFALAPSSVERARLNLLIPTINPKETWGGVSTALTFFLGLKERYSEVFDFRIVVTDAPLSHDALSKFPEFTLLGLDDVDHEVKASIVNGVERQVGCLWIRRNDIFVATAWWTAKLSFDAVDALRLFFGKTTRVVYLIQDFEPNFYGWGSRWQIAENTYRRGSETIAVFNSEELAHFMCERYEFSVGLCLPYSMNVVLRKCIEPRSMRAREILVYGRPSVSRNGFELIVDGLFLWQQRFPNDASRWKIISVGEDFSPRRVGHIHNIEVAGKVTLERYSEYLSSAAIGVSLMFSTHPSYPPLEMAEAGMITITNRFQGKDLQERSSNFVALQVTDAESIADAIGSAVAEAERLGMRVGANFSLRPLDRRVTLFSYDSVMREITKHIECKASDVGTREINGRS